MDLFWIKWTVACVTALWVGSFEEPNRFSSGEFGSFFKRTSQVCRKGKKADFCQPNEKDELESKVVADKRYYVSDREEVRVYRDIVLACGSKGEARFTISLPEQIPPEGLPCIIIIGGLKTGRESLQFIPNHGKYALIGYEYPQMLHHLRKVDLLWHFFSVRRELLNVPGQILSMVQYLVKESWIDRNPISLMGYSFGSVFYSSHLCRCRDAEKCH